jgi:hypothetical protein
MRLLEIDESIGISITFDPPNIICLKWNLDQDESLDIPPLRGNAVTMHHHFGWKSSCKKSHFVSFSNSTVANFELHLVEECFILSGPTFDPNIHVKISLLLPLQQGKNATSDIYLE